MAERSFKAEVEHLRKGTGDTFTGEGILAITKALLDNHYMTILYRFNTPGSEETNFN